MASATATEGTVRVMNARLRKEKRRQKFERDWDIVYLSNMAERNVEAAVA